MAFSSIPVYLDPPNWQQQQPNQLLGGGNEPQTGLQLPPLPPSAGGQSRPGSMSDRARLAKLPHPEAALKCPRCDSSNTKFCYYNNYSLSQPRHFCKTCRRYWTRGGALRNVPVGGGCRRNRRSKRCGGSKSQATAVAGTGSAASTGSGALPTPPPPPASAQLPFLPPLQTLGDYGNSEFQVGTGSGSGGGGHVMVPNGLLLGDQWRVQQFPFLASFGTAPSGGLFQFDHSDHDVTNSNSGLNLMPRNLLGLSESFNYQPLWNVSDSSNEWTDASGLASTSVTSHHQRAM